jgi:copper homeostasis protein
MATTPLRVFPSLTLVEAAVETLDAALAATRAGADRLELCANLGVGGTTPSAQLIAAVVAQAHVPVFVMIRPRGGDFVYSGEEIDAMIEDIDRARPLGIAGIVTGALRADGSVDMESMRGLVSPAAGLPITFHKAIDVAANPPEALEQIIELGATRVLTSGSAATALDGASAIAALVDQAGERISVMAGGSIREHNARDVIARSHVRELHARLVDEAGMRRLMQVVRGNWSLSVSL